MFTRCQKNCCFESTSHEHLVHIQADCTSCKTSSPINFEWKQLSPPSTQTFPKSSRLILPPNSLNFIETSVQYIFEVLAQQEKRVGSAQIILTINRPPQIGPCSISPTIGTQYSTLFSIVCQREDLENRQLTFDVLQNGSTLISSDENKFNVRLFSNETLKIKVQDTLGSSAFREVQVTLSEMPELNNYQDIKNFLIGNNESSGLAHLAQNGDFYTAIALIRTSIQRIGRLDIYEEKHSLASQILDNLQSLEFNRPVQLEIHTDVMCAISRCVPVDHRLAKLNSKLLNRLSIFLEGMCSDLETPEQRIIEKAARRIVETLHNLIQPFDKIDVTHDYNVPVPNEYPFEEHYEDYGDLDNKVLDKVEDLLCSTEAIRNVMQSLSKIFAAAMEPEEPTLVLNYGKITAITYVKSGQDAGDVEIKLIPNNETRVVVSEGYLRSNGLYGRSKKFVVSGVFFEQNPFWWYPEPNQDEEVQMIFVSRGSSRTKTWGTTSRRRVSNFKMTYN